MTKAIKTAKASKSVSSSKGEAKVSISKADQIFAKSVQAIKAKRSTGSESLDKVGEKVLYAIHDGNLTFQETKTGYVGTLGKAQVQVDKISKGKVNRTILNVAGLEIQGEFAARAYKMGLLFFE